MRYLTHYEEYPIYEAAEGGYYYAGNQVVESERMSKRKAKKQLMEIWAMCDEENEENRKWEERTGQQFDYWVLSSDRNSIWKSSWRIGDGESYVIEKNLGSETEGWHPYC